jgi:cobaltochelatase CobN
MKIVSIMWNSYVPMFKKVAEGMDLTVYSSRKIADDPGLLEKAEIDMQNADLLLLYRTRDLFWEELEKKVAALGSRKPIICLGHDPSYWLLSNVRADIVATAQSYLTQNGEDNVKNLLLYVRSQVLHEAVSYAAPAQMPWDGIFHPGTPELFNSLAEYLDWYKPDSSPVVAMLCSRMAWINKSLEIENALIRELEARGLNVIPIFSYSIKDQELGTKGMEEIIKEFFLDDPPVTIDALIKLNPFFLGSGKIEPSDTSQAASGVKLLERLGVPVFQPIISSYMTPEEWESSGGLTNDIGWGVAMPEFEGVIEPIIVGFSDTRSDSYERKAIPERCSKLASRVKKWIDLRKKPVSERKVAFILHNSPCASVEASVGGAAHLDSLESVSRILKQMEAAGYGVLPPASGKALIDDIMRRKAISEFRWTSVDEIVRCGGVLALITPEEYDRWFNGLSDKVKARMNDAWGNPPGELKNGIPAAMVYDGKIVVTGVRYGNAVVCTQPKRGCAGSRCDGQVCKILHDPDVPPTHQYIATYRYLEDVYGADVLVHVGTHGNVEFLPGKGVGLSADCYPDITVGTIPHLYIYNADNPPEGTIAKRRSNACLVDHMQTVLTGSGLYDELEEVDRLLGEYETAKYDPARSHALEHLLLDAIKAANLDREIRLEDGMPLSEIVSRAHGALGRIRNTQIQSGMHIFGEAPVGAKRVDFIYSILRYGDEGSSVRHVLSSMMGLDLKDLLSNQEKYSETHKKPYGRLLEDVDAAAKRLVGHYLAGEDSPEHLFGDAATPFQQPLEAIRSRVLDIDRRLRDSDEIGALMRGFDGGYIPSGPSGLITKGREDILPTGRNFYSLDPHRVPTKSAWKVGRMLARSVIEKHRKDEGKIPENVAYYWMCNDIMWADGEGMAMVMYLLGVEPVWGSNGRLKSFSVIPLDQLGRPRIDVTIRVSGIARDNFPNCLEVIDEAIQAVASLEEPPEMNYPRKHALEMIGAGDAASMRDATLRIFGSKPGTYASGVNLAIYASAWKDEKDISDIFVYWNGYAYGKGVAGRQSQQQLVDSLKTVDATFNKSVSDEYDLFGCCCYFGNQGGMTAAARHYSGKDVKAYYGDTREPEHVEVRDLSDEIRRVVRTKLLNPKWIEGMKEHGYKGAGDIMKRIGRVYGWEATTQEVDDWVFDDITRTFVLDEVNRKFFEENNPYALEEIARRLLEANQRGLWDTDPELLEQLKSTYLEIEGWMEERAGNGEYQGGSIDVMTSADVEGWGEKMSAVMSKIHR